MAKPAGTDLKDEVDQFIQHLINERGLSRHTISSYLRDLVHLKAFCIDQSIHAWRELQTHHLRQFIATGYRRGLTSKSLQRRLSSTRTFFHYLVREAQCKHNPAIGVSAPKMARKLPDTLDADQVAQLLNLAPLTTGTRAEIARSWSSFTLPVCAWPSWVNANVNDVSWDDGSIIGHRLRATNSDVLPVGSSRTWTRLQTWQAGRRPLPVKQH